MSDSVANRSKRRYISLRVKIWFGFILIFTPVFIASYFWFYQYTSDRVLQTVSDKLVDTINGSVKGMDTAGFIALYQQESTSNPACSPSTGNAKGYYPETNPLYIAHENWLQTVTQISTNTRIYTYVKGPGPGDIVAIGSTGYFRNPRGGFKFCELYNSKGQTRIADGLNGRVDRWVVYTDSFGSWITTYAPITDKDGKNIGAIGVDISADYVQQVKQGILVSGAIAFVISYILIFFLVYLMSGIVTKPIVSLAGVATDIGDGNYEQDWSRLGGSDAFPDEISTLTRIFHAMADKVRQREQKLIRQVEALKIEIDETKRKKQVSEIADSDFFRELQNKAREMRSHHGEE